MKLLAPHNDDETLFAAYTCLRERPKVVVILRSFVEAGWDPPVTYVTRERETAAACEVLGVECEWTFRDDDPNWVGVGACIADLLLEVKRGWGPLPDSGGHAHHDAAVWGGGCPTCLNNHNRPGDSTWYRVKTKFPSPGRICAAILAVAEDGRIAGSGDH